MLLDTAEKELHPVVCLHSLFLDPTMFDELVEAGRGLYRFIRPEFPGQASTANEADHVITMDECADHVLYELNSLNLESFSLLGQSMGGDVAVRVAARAGSQLRTLIFSGSSVCAESPENLEQFGPVCDEIEKRGFDEELTEVVMHIMFGASTLADPQKSELLAFWRSRISSLSANLHWAVRGVVGREDATALLTKVSVPTLVINGMEDFARPDAWSQSIADNVSDAERLQVANAGHSALLEVPETVIPRIFDFLERKL